ncbi:MAG: toll/interleukin-1 receptor domain-containing protein [Thermoguttaceae bacterium]|nr:toll/interleukin-1 receptor domain-containing protein [Thermoguttaceae bacterium]
MDKAAEPLKIFISYGREIDESNDSGESLHPKPNSDIVVRKIKAYLESRGHEVCLDREWLGRNEIKDLPDRRKALYDAAKWSDVAIICLSPNVLKDNGVCQDDVAMILNVLGENHILIKLEELKDKESKNKAYPSYLSNRQFSMLDLDLKSTEGGIDDGWLEKKFKELDAMIANSLAEKIKWQNEMAELEKFLQLQGASDKHQNLDVDVQDLFYEKIIQAESDPARFFCERKALFEWFEDEIKRSGEAVRQDRILYLKEVPDFGKNQYVTGLLYWYKFAFGDLYFIDNNQEETLELYTFVKFVAYRLAKTNSSYRERLISYLRDNPDEVDQQKNSPQTLFRLLVDNLLSDEIDGGRATQWILVDALEKASVPPRNSIASFICQSLSELPQWVSYLITTRNDDDDNTVNRYLAPFTPIELSKEERDGNI